jgi:hypothetical protein
MVDKDEGANWSWGSYVLHGKGKGVFSVLTVGVLYPAVACGSAKVTRACGYG